MSKKLLSVLILIVLTAQLCGCSEAGTAEKDGEPQVNVSLTVIQTSAAIEATDGTSETHTVDTSSESGSQTEPASAEQTEAENTAPEWVETESSGERYVNTDYIYSRISAIQGSEKVKQYRINDKVTVTAKTDTGYYKTEDGTFIHGDYLSESKIADTESGGGDHTSDASRNEQAPTDETGEANAPEWTETDLSGERYVNTNYIYSRISAIQGSEKVKQYRLNDKVTVTAKTDTGYYKTEDGTYIHEDYLSEKEIPYNGGNGADYTSVTSNGYVIERIDGITYVDGIMIANKTYTLPAGYDPGIKKEASDALAEMQQAAAAEGLSLFVVSGYRSYYSQEAVYAGWVSRDGAEQADTYSSRAGHSDHQTGYTFDLNSLDQSFAYTAEGIWLAEHCAEFGFIIRYPEGKEMYTGYIYEPWHVRYIGREKAKAITESGLSLEEYYGITSDYAYSVEG